MSILNLKELRRLVAMARHRAIRDGNAAAPYIQSRGMWLATSNKDGQCPPSPEGECDWWKGTLKQIKELVYLIETKYPEVETVYVAGGYDGYASFHSAVNGDDYEPWVSQWEVDVWKKGVGYVVDGGSYAAVRGVKGNG